MNTKKKLSTFLILSAIFAVGCSGSTSTPDSTNTNTHQHDAEATQPAAQTTTAPSGTPTLDMSVKVNGDQATIQFTTTNFTISPNHYNGEHVAGEGHIHLFVDGNPQRIAVKGETYVLSNVKPGTHKLEAQLHTNNHQPYNVKDEATFVIK